MDYRLDWSIKDGNKPRHGPYHRVQKGFITISPVRKIDEDWACNHVGMFDKLIDMEFGK